MSEPTNPMEVLGPPMQFTVAEIMVMLTGLSVALGTEPPEGVQQVVTGLIDKLTVQVMAITGESIPSD